MGRRRRLATNMGGWRTGSPSTRVSGNIVAARRGCREQARSAVQQGIQLLKSTRRILGTETAFHSGSGLVERESLCIKS